MPFLNYQVETKRREPDVLAIGRHERVAGVFEEEDGTRGGGEGRRGERRCKILYIYQKHVGRK